VVTSAIRERQIQTPTWQWQNWHGLPYLTCSLLQDWQHGFFTQQFYPNLPESIVDALNSNAEVYHGNRVLTPGEIETEEDNFPAADGIITDNSQQAIWVASADCTPALIGDIQTGRVSAVHAGWRGTAQGIIPEAIARFVNDGSVLKNLRIAMGPAISGSVYQVTEEVAAEVGASLLNGQKRPTDEILETLQQIPNSPISKDSQPGRVRLDVRRVNYLQLINLGISPEQIAIAPYCTYQQREYFFSYRRTQEKKVQWSGIISN
jgi:polyphenol oxidase